jgi:tRNA wybutosine-synthesizing protein 2
MTSPPPPFGVCVSVPAPQAGQALDQLTDEGLRDVRYRVRQEQDRVLIPVRGPQAALAHVDEGQLVEAQLEHDPRRPPIEVVRERLQPDLDDDGIAALPEGWTRLGDVLLLRLPEELAPHAETVARAYGDVLEADSVLHLEGSKGPWREPQTRLLWGDADTETVHREHGIAYHLDPREVMFSPGNKTERHRLRDHVREDETVVDLFAGIGYFALPLAAAGADVVACEANPTAARYLGESAEANDLADRIQLREGDCRQRAPADVADRVHMGYFPGTEAFLPTAIEALDPAGGWLHYHDRVPRDDPLATAEARVREHEALADLAVHREQAHVVKTLDPRNVHVALDLRVEPR